MKMSEPQELLSPYTDRGFIHSHYTEEYPDTTSYSAYVSGVKTNSGLVSCTFELSSVGGRATVGFDSYGDDDGSKAIIAAEDFALAVSDMVSALKKAVAIRNAARKVKE